MTGAFPRPTRPATSTPTTPSIPGRRPPTRPPTRPPGKPAKPPKQYAYEYWDDLDQIADVMIVRSGEGIQVIYNPLDPKTIELTQSLRYGEVIHPIKVEQYQPHLIYIGTQNLYSVDDVIAIVISIAKHLGLSIAEMNGRTYEVKHDFWTETEANGTDGDEDTRNYLIATEYVVDDEQENEVQDEAEEHEQETAG